MVQGRADEEELSSGFNRGVNLEVDVEAQKPKRTSSVGSGLKRVTRKNCYHVYTSIPTLHYN